MKLRITLATESEAHWEGERLVDDPPKPVTEDPLYRWAHQTHQLLSKEFPEYADAFFGDSADAGSGYFMLAYVTEIKKLGARQQYLERRIAQLSTILRETA